MSDGNQTVIGPHSFP